MFRFLGLLALFLLMWGPAQAQVQGEAVSVPFNWKAPLTGTPLGYKLHLGSQSGKYANTIDVGLKLSHSIDGLIPGKVCYIAATAYYASGKESIFSNEVQFTPLPVVVVTHDPPRELAIPANVRKMPACSPKKKGK